MNQIIQFGNQEIRMVGTPEALEWVGKDLCDVLGYRSYGSTLSRLPQDEKSLAICETLSGPRKMITVKEPGFYRLVFGSKLPFAEAFKSFVFNEVLPSIRKHGYFSAEKTAAAHFVKLLHDLQQAKMYPYNAMKLAMMIFKVTDDMEEVGDLMEMSENFANLGQNPNDLARAKRFLTKQMVLFQHEKALKISE